MHRDAFVRRSLLLFGLVAASFVVLGFSRLVLPYRVARVLAAPLLFASAVLAVVLVVHAALVVVGVRDGE